MPQTPFLINGTIYNSSNNPVSNASIEFSSLDGTKSTTSNSSGQYLFDLAEIGYSSGETISYTSFDSFRNEKYVGSFIVTGENKSLNVNLSVRENYDIGSLPNRNSIIHNIGGKPVSKDNPFPIINISNNEIDLVNNPSTEWTYNSDNLVSIEKVTLANGDIYSRSYTYNATLLATNRTKWQKV